MKHYSVLLEETIKKLKIKNDGIYIDCTLGLGGHTQELAKRASKGQIISFDQDINSLEYARKKLSSFSNIIFINDNFKNLEKNLKKLKIEKVDGILYDLGTSYYQLTNKDRGFTYHGEVKLDMRMNTNQKLSAIEVVNEYSEEELKNIFHKYGDESNINSLKIAKEIIKYRSKKKITLNTELNEIIKSVKGYRREKHPSKNIFQSIRIEVNNEMNLLKESLKQAVNFLNKNGVIAVITFHSLEDRIVKDFFWNKKENYDITPMGNIFHWKSSKIVYPTKKEIKENKAARSAKLRTLIKLTD